MATHSRVLAWRIPGTGEPGGLPSIGSHRLRHKWSCLVAAAAYWAGSRVSSQIETSTPITSTFIDCLDLFSNYLVHYSKSHPDLMINPNFNPSIISILYTISLFYFFVLFFDLLFILYWSIVDLQWSELSLIIKQKTMNWQSFSARRKKKITQNSTPN